MTREVRVTLSTKVGTTELSKKEFVALYGASLPDVLAGAIGFQPELPPDQLWFVFVSDISAISVIGDTEIGIFAVDPTELVDTGIGAGLAMMPLKLMGEVPKEDVPREAATRFLSFGEFWKRAADHFYQHVRRYFWAPLAGLIAAYGVLSWRFYLAEQHRLHIGVWKACYAVWLFMATIGFRAGALDTQGEVLAVLSSGLGIIGLGLLVALLFYSVQD